MVNGPPSPNIGITQLNLFGEKKSRELIHWIEDPFLNNTVEAGQVQTSEKRAYLRLLGRYPEKVRYKVIGVEMKGM